jgi:hypothetical protein
MRALSASDLLDIWERGAGRAPVEQALAILSIAFPQVPEDALAMLDFVQRDLCLLHLQSLTFGPQIKGLADCPACGQRLELDFDARDLPAWSSPLPDPESRKSLYRETALRLNDYEVTFRLPNSIDLSALSKLTDASSRRQQLLQACVISAQRDGKTLTAGELPSETLNLLVDRMNQDNPLADLTLPVTCPACRHAWEIIFDIVSYFWSEINGWSIRLMREVHMLAMTYGWREADILGMSAWRRQHYLEMIGV